MVLQEFADKPADPCWQRANPATLFLEWKQGNSIKEITVVVRQDCVDPAENSCTNSEVQLFPPTLQKSSCGCWGQYVEPMPEAWIEALTTHEAHKNCTLDDKTLIETVTNKYLSSPTEFWERYAATTGKF